MGILRKNQHGMNEQNYDRHSRYVKGFHFVLAGLLIIGVISSLVNIWIQVSTTDRRLEPILIALLFICALSFSGTHGDFRLGHRTELFVLKKI